MIKQPSSMSEALAHALALSISAPTKEKRDSATELADSFAAHLDAAQVEGAQRYSLQLVENAMVQAEKEKRGDPGDFALV